MRALLFVPYYLHWHYGRALKGIGKITATLVWFLWHFFSVGLLLKTFFDPWQRIQEHSTKRFDIEGYFSTLLVNTVMRCVGILIRTIFIIVGLIAIIFTALGGVTTFLVWLVLPVASIVVFIFGFILLFKAA